MKTLQLEGDTKQKKWSGLRKIHHKNGKLKSEVNYVDGIRHGNAKDYYETGQLRLEMNYDNGKKHGKSHFYHPNGKLYKLTTYQYDKKHGEVKTYYDTGLAWTEGEFNNGQVCLGFKEYHQSGRPVSMPKIVVKNKRFSQKDQLYTFDLSLSNESNRVKFYLVDKGGACINFDDREVRDQYTENGIATVYQYPTPHNYVDVYALYTSPYKNKILLKKRLALQ